MTQICKTLLHKWHAEPRIHRFQCFSRLCNSKLSQTEEIPDLQNFVEARYGARQEGDADQSLRQAPSSRAKASGGMGWKVWVL